MIIIKTIGQDTFSWNPNAFNKRGHWFLLAETGSYIRIATKAEMSKLGSPKKEDVIQDKDVNDKKMSYQQAASIRKKSLKNLITEKLVEGGSIGSSITGSISEKMKARTTGLKEKFDPLNIAKMLTGNLGSALLGKITGRSKEDIGYFAGDKKYKETKPKAAYVNQKLNMSDTALYSAISEGNTQSMRKGDGIATVLARMYNLIKAQQIESLKRFQIEKNFKKIKEKQKDKWNKELIEALSGGKKTVKIVKENKKEESTSIFDWLSNKFSEIKSWIENKLKSLTGGAAKAAVVGAVASAAGKKILDKIPGKSKDVTPMDDEKNKKIEKTPKENEKISEKEKTSEHKTTEHEGKKVKEELKTKEEVKESIEKGKEAHEKKEHKEKAKKVEKVETKPKPKVSKMSKALKGAKGVLKFLGKIPFLAGVAGAVEMMDEIKEAIHQHESGELTDNQLKKKVAESVAGIMGGAAGAQLGATIGATVGSVVPIGGTFVGGAIGAVGGFFGGKKLGEVAAEKLFDRIANSESEVEPKVTALPQEETEMAKPAEQPKAEGIKKSKVTDAVKSATEPAPTPTATAQEPKVTPVPTPNMTDVKLQSTMDKNIEMKAVGKPAVNTTVIDNSQNINASGGDDGGIIMDNSVSTRIDDPTLQRILRQNLRPQ